MKWLLGISLLANGILGYKLSQKPTVIENETVITKKSAPRIIEKKVFVEVPITKKSASSSASETKMQPIEFDEKDMEDVVTKVNQDREDFLTGTLNISPQTQEKIQAVKDRFNKRYMEIIPPDQYGELTIEQRRQLLDLEVERDQEFGEVMGQKKWEEFQKYRDNYNRKMFNRQVNEQGIVLPMEI